MKDFIEVGHQFGDEDGFDVLKIIRISNIKAICRDMEFMNKHDDASYDEEGNRKVQNYDINFTLTDDTYIGESYQTELDFARRWNQLLTLLTDQSIS